MPRLKMLFFIVLNLGASLKASERQHPASTDNRRLFPRFLVWSMSIYLFCAGFLSILFGSSLSVSNISGVRHLFCLLLLLVLVF